MSETCFYHPKARASATCPGCQQIVCDRCRAEGDFTTCGTCIQLGPGAGVTPELLAAAQGASGGADPLADLGAGGYATEAYGGDAGGYAEPAYAGGGSYGVDEVYEEPTCTNHPNLPAEMQCMSCFQPFCLDCCPSGYCPNCAPQHENRVRQQLSYQPTGDTATLDEVGANYETFDDLSAGYDEIVEAPPPPPRPRKPKQGGAGKKGSTKPLPKGAKGPPAKGGKKGGKKGGAGLPWGLIAGGLVGLAVLGGGGFFAYKHFSQPPAAVVPVKTGIAFVKPAERSTVSGVQMVQVKITSPESATLVSLTINGRHWNKWKPPFTAVLSTEWPTTLPQFRNGKQKMQAVVEYEDGQRATAKREASTRN